LGIRERVHFAGWSADVTSFLRASDLFVLPSRWEGMPNALLEAMAAGLPAVAVDVEGVSELLGRSRPGQIVAPGDAVSFSRQIVHWCRDRQSARQAGATNRQIVSDEFSIQHMIERYQALYASKLPA
jgi:glycosyltransferase involved in cell wall biosynthesis